MLVADRTDMGRLFQVIGPAVANACLPKLVRVLGTIRSPSVAERRRRRASIMSTWLTKFDSYAGALPCKKYDEHLPCHLDCTCSQFFSSIYTIMYMMYDV